MDHKPQPQAAAGRSATDNQDDISVDAEIVQGVLRAARAAAPDKLADLNAETELVQLGLDSVKQLEIIGRIEEVYSIRIPERELWRLNNCGDIARAVASQVKNRSGPNHEGRPSAP